MEDEGLEKNQRKMRKPTRRTATSCGMLSVCSAMDETKSGVLVGGWMGEVRSGRLALDPSLVEKALWQLVR